MAHLVVTKEAAGRVMGQGGMRTVQSDVPCLLQVFKRRETKECRGVLRDACCE